MIKENRKKKSANDPYQETVTVPLDEDDERNIDEVPKMNLKMVTKRVMMKTRMIGQMRMKGIPDAYCSWAIISAIW